MVSRAWGRRRLKARVEWTCDRSRAASMLAGGHSPPAASQSKSNSTHCSSVAAIHSLPPCGRWTCLENAASGPRRAMAARRSASDTVVGGRPLQPQWAASRPATPPLPGGGRSASAMPHIKTPLGCVLGDAAGGAEPADCPRPIGLDCRSRRRPVCARGRWEGCTQLGERRWPGAGRAGPRESQEGVRGVGGWVKKNMS